MDALPTLTPYEWLVVFSLVVVLLGASVRAFAESGPGFGQEIGLKAFMALACMAILAVGLHTIGIITLPLP